MELEQIGKYTILDRLSSGKTANAYRAVDPTANRLVFLKILNIPEGISPLERHSLVDHFYGEARSAGGLTHPNLVTLYEIGEDLGRHYIAMEFLEGVSVRRLLDEQGRLPMDQAVEIARCVCQALVYAHKKGVIHRDVKPDNIVVMEEMAVKLTDFGIARVEGDIRRTQVGIILGSPAYMSPEQIKGAAIDARTDIFSLGVCLYEMLSGRKPFDAPSATAVMQAIVKDPPRPLEDAPESLQNILRKAMAKDPAYRYPGAAEMLADLKAFRPDGILLPEPPEGLPAGAEEAVERTLQPTLAPQEIAELRESLLTPPPHTRRFSWVGALFAVVLLAITAAGAYLYARLNPPPGPAQASENRPFAAYARPIPPASPGLTVLSDLEKGRAGWEPALGQTATGFGELSVQKGMAADGSFWLRAGGIRFHGDWGLERGGVYYNPDSNDWSLLGNVVRAQLYLPPAAPPALRARLGIRNTLGQWLWMPGPGAALRPGRWNLVQWKADVPALADVSRLAVVLEGKNIAYSGAFGVDGLTVTRK